MNKIVYILPVAVFFYSCKPQAQQPQLPVTQIQSDFDSLRSALKEAHSGLYRYSSRERMDSIFDHYRSQLDHPMTNRQFIFVIAGLLPEVRDGHLRLEPDPETISQISNAKLLPLRLTREENKLIVLFNDTPGDHTVQPGMELLSINDHKPGDLIPLFLSKISDDGYIESGKVKRMERNFATLYWLFVDNDSVFSVRVKDPNGNVFNATLNGIKSTDRERNNNLNPVNNVIIKNLTSLEGAPENISIRFVTKNIAAIRVRSFVSDSFYDDIDSAFSSLHRQKAKTLILDLRGNGGGVDNYGAYLVAQFMDHSFRYFDHIRMNSINPSFAGLKTSSVENFRNGTTSDPNGGYLVTTAMHDGVGEQAPGKNPFHGKLIVLMDGGTFSTAADATALLRHLTPALFIGEESGGSYEGNTSGSSARFRFPYSKLVLNINMYDYYNAVKPAVQKGRGTMPDFAVPVTVSDLLKGTDAPWEKAMQLATADN